jgi:hypothetical protein
LSDFNEIELSREIFEKYRILRKSVQWEVGMRTDNGQAYMMQLIVAFHNFVNVPKKLLKSGFLRILSESENIFFKMESCVEQKE